MEQETCTKCGCIKLAHTGTGGSVKIGFGMVVHCDQGYCIPCIQKPEPCFAFLNK